MIATRGASHALHAHADARLVHHAEHEADAAAFLADDPAFALLLVAEVEHAGGRSMDAHFFFGLGADHVVWFPERPVLVHEDFRDEEKAQALHALGCAVHVGQDEVDDVFGQVMIARGDEHLGPGDDVGAVVGALCGGGRVAQGCAHVRFGQAHGPGPAALDHLVQVRLAHFLRTEGRQQVDRRGGEAGRHGEGAVGADHRLGGRGGDETGKALAADVRGYGHRVPAALAILFVEVVKHRRHFDHAVFHADAFLVRRKIRGRNFLTGELDRLADDHPVKALVVVLERRKLRQRRQVQVLEQTKQKIPFINGEIHSPQPPCLLVRVADNFFDGKGWKPQRPLTLCP